MFQCYQSHQTQRKWMVPWYCAHWAKIPLNKNTGPKTGDDTDVFWSAQFGQITINIFAANVTLTTAKIIIWILSYGRNISTVPSVSLKDGSVASLHTRFKKSYFMSHKLWQMMQTQNLWGVHFLNFFLDDGQASGKFAGG